MPDQHTTDAAPRDEPPVKLAAALHPPKHVGSPPAGEAVGQSAAQAAAPASRASARRRRVPTLDPADRYVDVDAAERQRFRRRGWTYGDGTGFGRWTPEGIAHRIRQSHCPPHARAALSRALATATAEQIAALASTRISERGVWVDTLDAPTGVGLHPPKAERAGRTADYVTRCPRSQYEARHPPLILWTWDRGHPETARRHVATCGSWRCDGCAPKAASIAFARIREAFSQYDAADVVFVVLTLDQQGRFSGERWSSVDDVYRDVSRRTRNWLKRINRWCEREGVEGPGSRWVATVEAHRTGWPHLNIVMVAPGLARMLKTRRAAALGLGASEHEARMVSGELLTHTLHAGWGPRSTAEVARSVDAVAGYIGKLAKLHDAAVGEIAKLTQRPDAAPLGTRRIRSGVGFLPPRRKSEYTGALVQSWLTPEGPVVHCYGRRSKLDAGTIEREYTRTADADVVIIAEARWLVEHADANLTAGAGCRVDGVGVPAPPLILIDGRIAHERRREFYHERGEVVGLATGHGPEHRIA